VAADLPLVASGHHLPMLRSWVYLLVLPMALSAFGADADESEAAKVRIGVQANDAGAQVGAVDRSPVSGLYLATIDGVSGYVSADGRYFIVGDMLDLASRTNVTEKRRKEMRRALLKKIAPDEAIVFGPAKPKYTVIVFTDADCPYCRKLHGELEQLQAKGIAVRYVAFPRAGPQTKSWRTMAAVWCSKDRQDALTRATRGDAVSAGKKCSDAVIAKHYALGQELGIPGTPMIVLSDGTSLGGYMSPDRLLVALAEHTASERSERVSRNSHEQGLAAGRPPTRREP
jgi:thiol:disulfide interchange protein DsbC